MDSKRRTKKQEAQDKATYDYLLADLIGKSIARIYSKDAKYPELYEAYPQLFNKDEIEKSKEEIRLKNSSERMINFAESFNKRFKNKEANN